MVKVKTFQQYGKSTSRRFAASETRFQNAFSIASAYGDYTQEVRLKPQFRGRNLPA